MRIVRLTEAPELESGMWELGSMWPRFMMHDKVADTYYARLDVWGDHVRLAVDGDEVIGRSLRITFAMGSEFGRPDELPDDGWDAVIMWAHNDRVDGRPPTHTSALEITLREDQRGRGIAGRLISTMAADAAEAGFSDLYAPVRPSLKSEEPDTPMVDYVTRVRDDGLPYDPWIRTHVRLGGEIVKVCPAAMTISGSLAQWRDWTGLPFDRSGPVHVTGALAPVHVSVEHDHAVYVEPNVWMRHRL